MSTGSRERYVTPEDKTLPRWSGGTCDQELRLSVLCPQCFMEMERVEDAEKMAEDCKVNPPKMNGKRLTIYVSRKYRQLKHG